MCVKSDISSGNMQVGFRCIDGFTFVLIFYLVLCIPVYFILKMSQSRCGRWFLSGDCFLTLILAFVFDTIDFSDSNSGYEMGITFWIYLDLFFL